MDILRTLILILACMSFITVIGGAIYEHAAVVPVWTSAIPASLSMFQGEYALAASRFWIPIHPITVSLLVGAMLLNWKTERRTYIATTVVGYAIVLATTFVYFVPELIELTQSSYSQTVNSALTARAATWETFSICRLVFLFGLAITLLLGLSRPCAAAAGTLK